MHSSVHNSPRPNPSAIMDFSSDPYTHSYHTPVHTPWQALPTHLWTCEHKRDYPPHNPAVRLKKLKTEWEVAVDPNSKGFLGVSSNNTDSKGVQNWYKDGVEIGKAHKWRVKEGPFEKVTLSKM